MNSVTRLIGRESEIFAEDVKIHDEILRGKISSSRFLVIGGAGTIGQAVSREIFLRNPKALHVVDTSENNLVELVRDIRSTLGYISGDFQALPLDCGALEYDAFISAQEPYDYIFNLSALKHVRSEKDPYSLMRMIRVNVENTNKLAEQATRDGCKNFFCVSSDKAANPVNMMGATKRVMEMFLLRHSLKTKISLARFANVAFSDGSLLHGFEKRMQKMQPLSAPKDVKRYFITSKESGELCLMAGLLGENRDTFFPNDCGNLCPTTFSEIAVRYLEHHGYEPFLCETEEEARGNIQDLVRTKRWPCFFFESDTTGEKSIEEFYTDKEELDLDRFSRIGVIKNKEGLENPSLGEFSAEISRMCNHGQWAKQEIVALFQRILPNFSHEEKNKHLDNRM